jgi:peptidoglycan/xylan/chitin deacetylase (PgdA/CDA1 family)
VITIDDGFASTVKIAAPALARHGFPATVYVTSYHVIKQTPVFDLVVAYTLWRTDRTELKLTGPQSSGFELQMPLNTADARYKAIDAIIRLGREADSEDARVTLCRRVGDACDLPYDDIVKRDAFRLMNRAELTLAAHLGLSIGLHTHRHEFPHSDLARCNDELADNEEALRRLGVDAIRHFCYPSGEYSPGQWPLLESLGIKSSTTCDTGLVRKGDPPHGLKRFLDGEMVSELEFDAEVCGFAELLRQAFGALRRLRDA